MAQEIERRFLLRDASWRPAGTPIQITQGYFRLGEQVSGRPRLLPTGPMFVLGEQIELPISWKTAWDLRDLCKDSGGAMPPGWKARVRCTEAEGQPRRYVFDLKGPRTGTTRLEFADTPLDSATGSALLGLCGDTRLSKMRYHLEHKGRIWEIDYYLEQNMGLVVAEVEIESPDAKVELPDWVGEEITDRKLFGT
jgi:CYTH domain-containing protein